MKKIKFVTLHPAGTNVDLTKDEGQIPNTLCSNYPVDAEIVMCHLDKNTANLNAVPSLKIKHVPYIINNSISGLLYLIVYSKKIDWLNIYFAGRQAYFWSKIFKFLNRHGKVYLKLDMDFRSSDLYDNDYSERRIFFKCTEIVDLISVESEALKNRIQKYSSKNIYVIGNGISKPNCIPCPVQQKENVFLTVARLGTRQKATDVLLQGFAQTASRHNWNLKLIGTMESEFQKYVEDFFIKYPHLRSRIIFLGPINDREALFQEYYKSKVFVLPSRWESYGISSAEALSCGCSLILTDSIPPAKEMTNNEKYGKIIETDNIESLGEAFFEATKKNYSENFVNEMMIYASKQFSWKEICAKLYDYMQD